MRRLITLTLIFFLMGCATGSSVVRVSEKTTIDLSGNWNDTDSRLVAQTMIEDALSSPWLSEFVRKHNRKPRIIVGRIRNRSHEHINTRTFVKDLERELTNSGKAVFVAESGEREEVRRERLEQMEYASPETVKALGREFGADFMLIGEINTILDEAGNTTVKYYQVELELINIETNEKVWIGQKKIKKIIKRPRVTW